MGDLSALCAIQCYLSLANSHYSCACHLPERLYVCADLGHIANYLVAIPKNSSTLPHMHTSHPYTCMGPHMGMSIVQSYWQPSMHIGHSICVQGKLCIWFITTPIFLVNLHSKQNKINTGVSHPFIACICTR